MDDLPVVTLKSESVDIFTTSVAKINFSAIIMISLAVNELITNQQRL